MREVYKLASRDKDNQVVEVNAELTMEQINRHLNLVDERLDNMDSVITSLVERIMQQPVTLEVLCPKCGQAIQINITSNVRAKG